MFEKIIKNLFGTEKKTELPTPKEDLDSPTYWDDMYDEDGLIEQILGDAETPMECLEAWKVYLNEKLILPFVADYCSEFDNGIPNNALVRVLKISSLDEEYGVMVNIAYENEMHTVPLFDLILEDPEADNYDVLEIYSMWFEHKE
jgi:hypothetical protein